MRNNSKHLLYSTISVIGSISMLVSLAACGNESATQDPNAPVTLTLTSNAIKGGKNDAAAQWIEDYVVPTFEQQMKDKGKNVTVKFQAQGVDDSDYNTKLALDLKSGKGADVFALDSMLVGDYVEAGYIKPLNTFSKDADSWEGWQQIPEATAKEFDYNGQRYGIPSGAGGRVLFYNKNLFKQAGLSEDWTPKSWDDVLSAARALKKLNGVTPIQLNAGTAMGEATTMQGFLPMLAGTGEQIYADGKWDGDTKGVRETLKLYKTIYQDEQLGDPVLQQEGNGRDHSFAEFAQNKIGILLESDYLWRSVINPNGGTAPMQDRDSAVGYALIPAMKPGTGVNGSDYVSFDGAGGNLINPNTKHKDLAWELLAFMNSKEAWIKYVGKTPRITPRKDVNADVLKSDKFLSFIADKAMPLSLYRPALSDYNKVSGFIQQATLDVATGKDVDSAVSAYKTDLTKLVGDDKVNND